MINGVQYKGEKYMKILKDIKNYFRELKRKEEYENRDIAQVIGAYYLEKNNNNYYKTGEDIRNLGITQIEHKRDTIIITLQRVGLLIGRRGENIDKLQKFLVRETKYTKLNIKDDKTISWLIPIDYSDYNDYL